jgi:hypothetical protein
MNLSPSDEDRETIIQIAGKALEAFQSKPKSKQNQENKDDAKTKAKHQLKTDPDAQPDESEQVPRTEDDSQLNIQAKPKSKNEGKLNESKLEPEEKL